MRSIFSRNHATELESKCNQIQLLSKISLFTFYAFMRSCFYDMWSECLWWSIVNISKEPNKPSGVHYV